MSSFAHSPYRRQEFEDTAFAIEPSWRQEYYQPQIAMLTHQWPNPQQHVSGIQHLDVRMFAEEEQRCPDLSYSQHDTWSDMETVGTPSTPVYSHDGRDSCFNPVPAPSTNHLQIPEKSRDMMGLIGSPHSSYGSISPVPSPMPMPMPSIHHPAGMGPVTGPNSRDRKPKISAPQSGEMLPPALEDDEDARPSHSVDAKRSSRKRARIPHTAVERRYRENLNAHLDRLRQTVPAFAIRGGREAGKSLVGSESVKPSKCEILNGAIEHIGCLTRENVALKNEVAALRARVGDYEGWYRANLR